MRNDRKKRVDDAVFHDIAEDLIGKVNTRSRKLSMQLDVIALDDSMPEEDKLKARIMQEDSRLRDFMFNKVVGVCMPDSGATEGQLKAILTIQQDLYDKAVDWFEKLERFGL